MTERDFRTIGLAMHSELVNRLAARLSGEFAEAGIPHVLLKGAANARWLYDPTEVRHYGDADFLVPRDRWDAAVGHLRARGFTDMLGPMAHPRMESITSHPWESREGDVDLHATLFGLEAPPETVWRELTAQLEQLELEGASVPVFALPARVLHVALHAAQHQDDQPQALADLDRALERVDEDAWRAAAALAERVGGEAAMASGLAIRPRGRELVSKLGLEGATSVKSILRESQVPLAEGLDEVLSAPGARAKAMLIAREVVPSPRFMRWWSPLARRGPAGLAAAYLWRPFYLLLQLPRAIGTLRRARRTAGVSDGEAPAP